MSNAAFISRFSPQRSSPEDLEAILVQREPLLRDCVEKVSNSILTANKHQQLLVGPRGAGKTHLLTLIQHRIGKNKKLKNRYYLAWLGEDDLSTSFLRLLVRIYQHLQQRYPEVFDGTALAQIFGLDAEIARAKLQQLLVERIGSKTLVLLIENLDAQLKQMSEAEQRNWRGFVQNHRIVATVASAQRLTDELTGQQHCFHGFYQVRHLMPLQVDDARAMLEKLAVLRQDLPLAEFLATSRGRARVQAIHHLAGGNPRLYVILSEFLNREGLESLVQPFEQMVDTQLTAYYQERMRWLSPQQQEIVQLLCRHRLPMAVKDIAAQLFNSQQTISSQLKLLKDLGYVAPHSVGRESHYELAEPLMRLTWQVKQNEAGKPLALLVDLLRIWFDCSELSDRLTVLPTGSQIAPYVTEALAAFERGEPNLRDEMHLFSLGLIDAELCDESELAQLQDIAEELNQPKAWMKLASAMAHHDRHDEVIDCATKVIDAELDDEELRANGFWQRIVALRNLDRNVEARADAAQLQTMRSTSIFTRLLALVLDAGSEKSDTIISGLEPLLADAKSKQERSVVLMCRAQQYINNGNYSSAVCDLSEVLEIRVTPLHVYALKLRAKCLVILGDFTGSESDATAALAVGGMSKRDEVALRALRGQIYQSTQRTDEALADFQIADSLDLGKNPLSAESSLRYFFVLATELDENGRLSSLAPSAFHRFLSRLDSESKAKYEKKDISGALGTLLFSIVENQSPIDQLALVIRKIGVELAILGWINHLGSALIHQLREWQPKSYKGEKLKRRAWLTLWQSMAQTHVELEIPVRIMQTAFALFDSGDERVLLGLPLEEREILCQALAEREAKPVTQKKLVKKPKVIVEKLGRAVRQANTGKIAKN